MILARGGSRQFWGAGKPTKRGRNAKSELTLKNHEYFLTVLSDWQSRPLAEITRQDVLARHKKVTGAKGPVAANNVMRWFRAVYNAALIVHENLPPIHPAIYTFSGNMRKTTQ